VVSTPFGLYLAWGFDFGAVTPGVWLLLFYTLAACIWTVWLWMTGLKTIPAAQSGVFTVMLPISAAMVGALVLGEALNGTQVLALGVAVLGVLLATLPTRWLRARRLFLLKQYLYYSKRRPILKATDQSRTRSRTWVP